MGHPVDDDVEDDGEDDAVDCGVVMVIKIMIITAGCMVARYLRTSPNTIQIFEEHTFMYLV